MMWFNGSKAKIALIRRLMQAPKPDFCKKGRKKIATLGLRRWKLDILGKEKKCLKALKEAHHAVTPSKYHGRAE